MTYFCQGTGLAPARSALEVVGVRREGPVPRESEGRGYAVCEYGRPPSVVMGACREDWRLSLGVSCWLFSYRRDRTCPYPMATRRVCMQCLHEGSDGMNPCSLVVGKKSRPSVLVREIGEGRPAALLRGITEEQK